MVVSSRSSATTPGGVDFGAQSCKRVVTISDLDPDAASCLADEFLYESGVTTSLERDEERAEERDEIFRGETKKLWDHCRLVVFMQDELDEEDALRVIERTASIAGIGAIDRRNLSVEDFVDSEYFHWRETAMKAFEPVVVSESIRVIPSREESTSDRDEERKGMVARVREGGKLLALYIKPGFAFGTGQHQTTKLCLVWLQENIGKGGVVLDYGSGSGVLAIASVLLGAGEVVATDIEEDSISAIEMNARLNDIDPTTQIRTILVDHEEVLRSASEEEECESLRGIQCDILIANILARPLRELAKTFAKHTKPSGKIALSGMLVDQVQSVRAAFEKEGFEHFKVTKLDEWALLEGTKKAG
jgi:ribosomal protein L11 methyltransferase